MSESKQPVPFHSGFVTIVGRPNVGKSTLINKFIGQKIAIMSDKPQTTRNTIQAAYSDDNHQIIFMDTPGIHKPKHGLGNYMLKAAYSSLDDVDLILFVVNANEKMGPGDRFIMNRLKHSQSPVILVINKIDLVEPDDLLPIIDGYVSEMDFAHVFPLSALEGINTQELLDMIKKEIPEGPQYYPKDQVIDHPERFLVAELIREKILHLTREEIPHSVAVQIENMSENDEGILEIDAVIIVEHKSQKGIIIGKQGSMIKQIRQLAQRDIRRLLGNQASLDIWVRVEKNWRSNQRHLESYGYDQRDYS